MRDDFDHEVARIHRRRLATAGLKLLVWLMTAAALIVILRGA